MQPRQGQEYSVRQSRREAFSWSVVGLIAIGFALRVFRLGAQSLWIDELLSLADATVLYHQDTLWSSLLQNLHGPLYSLVIFASWQAAGLSEFWLRFPSAVAGTATLGAMYALGSTVYDRHTAWWAVLILALSPFHIWYSQEARNYSLLLLFTTLSMCFLHRFLAAGGARPWGHYVWSTAAALLSNLSSFFLLIAQGAAVLFGGRTARRLGGFLVAGLIVVLVLSPWFAEFNERLEPSRSLSRGSIPEEELLRGETTFTLWGIPFTFFVFSLGYSVGPSLRELHTEAPLKAVGGELLLVLLAALVFGLVSGLGIWKTRDDRRTLGMLLLYMAVPIVLLSILAERNIKVFNPRYLMVSLPAYFLLLARGLSQVGRSWLRWGNLSLVLLLFLYSLSNYYFDPRYAKEDFRAAARYVEASARPQDVIVATSCRSLFDFYYTGAPTVWGFSQSFLTDERTMEERLEKITGEGDRLWLVQAREWASDPHRAVEKHLQSRFGLLEEQRFPGIRVSLFDMRTVKEEGNGG